MDGSSNYGPKPGDGGGQQGQQGQQGQHRQSFSFEPGVDSPYRRKNRSVQSCTRCRARKTKCDRKFPCGPCTLRSEADLCVEYVKEKSEKPTGYTHLADFQVLVGRVEQMEGVLKTLQAQNQELRARFGLAQEPSAQTMSPLAHVAPLPYNHRQSTDAAAQQDNKPQFELPRAERPTAITFATDLVQPKPKPFDLGFDSSGAMKRLGESSKSTMVGAFSDTFMPSDPVSRAPSRAEHDAALTLEDLALARGANIQRSAQGKHPFGHIEGAFDKSTGPPTPAAAPRLPNFYLLPSTSQAQHIIDFYLNKVDWLMRCIHRPTFHNQCIDFWAHDPKEPMTAKQFAFLPLYCACLALGLHLMETSDVKDLGYDEDAGVRLPKLWWELGYAAMEKMDWMQVHTMTSLQAIIIIGVFFSSINRGEYHWTLLGTANKIAQNMGLSRLGPEPTDPNVTAETISKRFGSRWVSAIDREVGRRVWANLVELDITFSIEKCMTYSIHERQHKAVEPANVDDEDLHDHGPIISKPRDVHTGMSFFLERLRLMYPIQKLVGSINEAGRVKYSFIMEAHQAYSDIISTTPVPWREDVDLRGRYDQATQSRIQIERIVLSNATCLRLLRVHRIYLSSSYQSHKYQLSREVCLSCARSLVRSGLSPIAAFPKPQRYWPITYGIFCAGIVLFFELCRASNDDAPRAREELAQAIACLRENAGNAAFQASASALEKLMHEESSQRAMRGQSGLAAQASAGNKRKRDDDGGDSVLNRLVKRVILFNSPQHANSLESPASTVGNLMTSPAGGSSIVSRNIPSESMMPTNMSTATSGIDLSSAGIGDDWSLSLADDMFNYDDANVLDILTYVNSFDPMAQFQTGAVGGAQNLEPVFSWSNGTFNAFGGNVQQNNTSGQDTSTQGW